MKTDNLKKQLKIYSSIKHILETPEVNGGRLQNNAEPTHSITHNFRKEKSKQQILAFYFYLLQSLQGVSIRLIRIFYDRSADSKSLLQGQEFKPWVCATNTAEPNSLNPVLIADATCRLNLGDKEKEDA